MKNTNEVTVDHAILFIFDPASTDIVIPEYDPGSPVSFNEACMSVNVRAAVDGEVRVHIGRAGKVQTTNPVVFRGKMTTPSGRIVVVTPNNQEVVSMKNEGETAELTIRLDSVTHASEVWVEVA
ncbi:hypothetical protein SH501x_002538 [Pirellulaceae bacterium SH501]